MRQNLENLSDDAIREEYVKRYTLKAGARLVSARTTADHLRSFYAESKYKESFVMICLNAQNEIIDTRVLFTGTIATSAVYLRELVKSILLDHIIIGSEYYSFADNKNL